VLIAFLRKEKKNEMKKRRKIFLYLYEKRLDQNEKFKEMILFAM